MILMATFSPVVSTSVYSWVAPEPNFTFTLSMVRKPSFTSLLGMLVETKSMFKPCAEFLVGAFKNQIIGVIPEIFRDLPPHALIGFHGEGRGFFLPDIGVLHPRIYANEEAA